MLLRRVEFVNFLGETSSLLSPITWQFIVATVIIFFGGFLASGGGLGGGGIFVPTFIVVLGFSSNSAVPLSQATIFAGSIVNIAMNMCKKHPTLKGYSMIEYRTVLMLEPALLVGTVIGVMLNEIFPSWLVVVLLTVVLVYISVRTIRKGVLLWESERRGVAPIEEQRVVLIYNPLHNEALAEVMEGEKRPWREILLILCVWSVSSTFSILKASPSLTGVVKCDTTYWILTAGLFVTMFGISVFVGYWLVRETLYKKSLGWSAKESEIEWNQSTVIRYPIFAMVAGLMGGLLGIGGGMITGPLLIELGMNSQAIAATSATAVLLTSSSAVLQYALIGSLKYDYALWFSVCSVITTFLGQVTVNYVVEKYGKPSVIILSISLVLVFATVLLGVSGVLQVIEDARNGNLGINTYC